MNWRYFVDTAGEATSRQSRASMSARNASESRNCCSQRSKRILNLVFVLALTLPSVEASLHPFTSDNGYEVGGTEPTCWDSTVDWTVVNSTVVALDIGSNSSATVEQNARFHAYDAWLYQAYSSNVKIRASCYEGVKLNITQIDKESQQASYYTGANYSLQVDLALDTTLISGNGSSSPSTLTAAGNSSSAVFLRLILCENSYSGFCYPFIGTDNGTDFADTPIIDPASGQIDEFAYFNTFMLSPSLQGSRRMTRYIRCPLQQKTQNSYYAAADIGFTVPLDISSTFVFLVHAVLFIETNRTGQSDLMRIDIADAPYERVVQFRVAPDILTITDSFKWFVVGFSIVTALILTALLAYVIHHRNHSVMKIAQGNFLALLLMCAIISSASLFSFMPIRAMFCNLSGILVIYPVTVMSCVMIGRLWRIYSTLTVAMDMGRSKKATRFSGKQIMAFFGMLANFHVIFKGKVPSPKKSTLREKITEWDLSRLIFVLSLPQLMLQMLAPIISPGEIGVVLSDDERVGKVVCVHRSRWIEFSSVIFLGFMFLVSTYVAWLTRDLPSLFNEKDKIFSAASVNAFIAFIVLSLIFITDDDTTSPNVTAFLSIILFMGITFTTIWQIVMPKIIRVWRGETVVVSDLMSGRRYSLNGTNSGVNRRNVASRSVVQSTNGNDELQIYRPITLHKEDPPPRAIEAHMLNLKEILTQISHNSFEGLQIPLDDWELLIKAVDDFHIELHRLEFGWTNDDEAEGVHTIRANLRHFVNSTKK